MLQGMKKLIILLSIILAAGTEIMEAQQRIDLSGKWKFGVGTEATCDDIVSLPGSKIIGDRFDPKE